MRQRCRNPNNPYYKNYGARGIAICERWGKFVNFLEDMGKQPKGGTLERIDNNGNYEPQNCKWANRWEQTRNERKNIRITVGSETMILQDWADRLGIHEETLRRWYHKGIWPQDFNRRPRPGYRPDFTPIPKQLQLEGRKAAIARWVRKHPDKAKDKLMRGIVPEEDANVMRVALGIQ